MSFSHICTYNILPCLTSRAHKQASKSIRNTNPIHPIWNLHPGTAGHRTDVSFKQGFKANKIERFCTVTGSRRMVRGRNTSHKHIKNRTTAPQNWFISCLHRWLSTVAASSSFPSKPKLRICSALGAFSRGCAASALRKAACIFIVRRACHPNPLVSHIHKSIIFKSPLTATYLFPVVEALVVVIQSWSALLLAGLALARVHHIASKNLLPERVAAGGT